MLELGSMKYIETIFYLIIFCFYEGIEPLNTVLSKPGYHIGTMKYMQTTF